MVGYTGLLSLCHAAFYGIGAYVAALLMTQGEWPFWLTVPTTMVITALISMVIAVPSLRLKGDYFLLATLGFQIIVFTILYNWDSVTHGATGISGIPTPQMGFLKVDTPFGFFLFSIGIALICVVLLYQLIQSSFGRALVAIREDEVAAATLGKHVSLLKILAFSISAAFAALAGTLFIGYSRYVDPTSFTVSESIFILSMVIIGGTGSMAGPVIGTFFVIVLPEVLRFLPLSSTTADQLRQIIYGLLLIFLMYYRPQGLCGKFKFKQ